MTSRERRAFTLRDARGDDATQLASVYGHYVRTHTSTFELEPPDAAEMARRLESVQSAGLPWLVAERAGQVLGFCYIGSYRARPAYRHTGEDSVYIDPACTRQGVGHALLAACLERCPAAGVREVIAVIGDSANTASIELHRRLGFDSIGTLRNVGYKFDRWLDTVFMQWSAPGVDLARRERST